MPAVQSLFPASLTWAVDRMGLSEYRWETVRGIYGPSGSGVYRVGAVAQLVERCNRTAEVRGSIPLSSMVWFSEHLPAAAR